MPYPKAIDPDILTRRAVNAALRVIDKGLGDSKKSQGPCGDALASKLDRTILKAIEEHLGWRKADVVIAKAEGGAK